MAKYGDLQGGQGFLEHYPTLDTNRKAEAEQEATSYVDVNFREWDRTTWDYDTDPATVPVEVNLVWRWKASAEFILRDMLSSNPATDVERLSVVQRLLEAAQEKVDEIRNRGYLVDQDGTQIDPVTPVSSSITSATVVFGG